MSIIQFKSPLRHLLLLLLVILFSSQVTSLQAGETTWMAVGNLQNWFHSAGCEVEIGRRHLIPDQQDGLRWPALFLNQDCQAAKALWIGTTDYNDPQSQQVYPYKVVHFGPRVEKEIEFIPVSFIMYGRYDHPAVYVDGAPASALADMEGEVVVDDNLPADRMLYNVAHTAIGITMTRKIYAFTQEYNDNYFIYDYVFKNTGIIDKNGTQVTKTLTGVVFHFQYRYAMTRECCSYGIGSGWMPQSATWGHNTMNDVIYTHPVTNDPFRAMISWQGLHSKWTGPADNIGGPQYNGDGHLGGAQYVGLVTIHADRSPQDPSDDINQPSTTLECQSDEPWQTNNDMFNKDLMQTEYLVAMTAGRPAESHAKKVGTKYPDVYSTLNGGYSSAHGFGPYTLDPGDSINIVMAEGAAGLNRKLCYEIGEKWLNKQTPYTLPNGSTAPNEIEYKNTWVGTGYDSLVQTFDRAIANYNSGFAIPMPPPPPDQFTVTSGGDRIFLTWSNNAESWPNFAGYRVYRSVFDPDTTFNLLYACGGNSGNPVSAQFLDLGAQRGKEYYYYIVSYDDGSTNTVHPGVPLESSKFLTKTYIPAFLRRPPGTVLDDVRIVPNPYNINARSVQWGVQPEGKDKILFVNIPPVCRINIYTESGDLIKTLQHTNGSGDESWNLITSSTQIVVSGLYIAHIEVTEDYFNTQTGQKIFSKGDSVVKKFIIIR